MEAPEAVVAAVREIVNDDWFRHVTGVLQIAGGFLFPFPRAVTAGALLVGLTMAGAVAVHLLVLDTGIGGAVFPMALLIFSTAVAIRQPA